MTMNKPASLLLGAAVSALVLGASTTAGAVERTHQIGLDPSLAMLKVEDKSTVSVGAGLALHYQYGLSDQFLFMGELGSAIVASDQQQDLPTSPKTRPAEVDHLTFGLGYVLDVLRWVPYFFAQFGGYRLAGGTLETAHVIAGVQVGVGLDYQITRHFLAGIALHQHFLASEIDAYPSYTTAMLRLGYQWGW